MEENTISESVPVRVKVASGVHVLVGKGHLLSVIHRSPVPVAL